MRFLLLCLFLISLSFISCGDDASTDQHKDSANDTIPVHDTVAQKDTVPAAIIASQLGGDTIVPKDKSQIFYSFTKKMLDNDSKALSAKEVTKRFLPVDPDCDEEAAWTLNRFFYLDSLKKAGEHPDSDMGQTILVEIREYDTISITDKSIWVAWTMYFKTEDACPFASGTYFMLSTYDKFGHLVSTQCMGRDVGGADAPLTWVAVQTGHVFSDGSFRALYCDSVGDHMDNGSIEYSSIIRKTMTGVIAEGGKITTDVKEIERND